MSRLGVEAVVAAVRCALRLYPSRFRRRFGSEVLLSVRREVEDAVARGRFAYVATAIHEVVEAFAGAIPQHRAERALTRRFTRKERLMHTWEALLADLRMAVRALRSSNTFTVVAIIVLALGVGATTAIFTVVDAVVLRGLPFDEDERLVAVGERPPASAAPVNPNADPLALQTVAPQNYLDWVRQQQVFESMAAIAGAAFTLIAPGEPPEELVGLRVSSDFFDVLRVRPAHGRPFTAENEIDGNHRIAVLSDGFWRRRFGGDPSVVGRTIALEAGVYEVAGIMPPGFEYPVAAIRPTELWVPYVVPAGERVRSRNTRTNYLGVIARLKPGVTFDQAYANIDQIGQSLHRLHPEWAERYAGIRPLRDHIVGGRTKSWMLMLLGAVALVLLIACANVANLLLARATVREREIAIRSAMGASRWRVIRQLMVESLLLSFIGTAFGVLLAWWGVGVLRQAMLQIVPRIAHLSLDLRVLTAAAVLSLLTAIIFGSAPALQLSKPDLSTALGEGGRGASAGRGRRRLRDGLVIAEVALSVILLVAAALFIGSFRMLMKIEPGFDSRHVLTASLQPRVAPGRGISTIGGSVSVSGQTPAPAASQPPDHGAKYQEIVDRLRQLPGVRYAAAIAGGTPLGGSQTVTTIAVPGNEQQRDPISIRNVTADYVRAMGIKLVAGRHVEPTDHRGGVPVVLLNQSAAEKYLPGGSALGRTISLDRVERTVVGIVGDVYQNSLETAPRTEAYVPLAQSQVIFAQLVVKTDGGSESILPAIKTAVLQVMPDVPLRNVRTMESVVGGRVALRRLNMLLIGLFGVLGLVISATGIYGVMAYLVSQRTREIGLRMALGATDRRVGRMVLRDAAALVGIGLAIGGAAAWYLSAAVKSFLFRIEPTDPRAFAVAVVAIGLAALAASILPARRAAKVDPIVALRMP